MDLDTRQRNASSGVLSSTSRMCPQKTLIRGTTLRMDGRDTDMMAGERVDTSDKKRRRDLDRDANNLKRKKRREEKGRSLESRPHKSNLIKPAESPRKEEAMTEPRVQKMLSGERKSDTSDEVYAAVQDDSSGTIITPPLDPQRQHTLLGSSVEPVSVSDEADETTDKIRKVIQKYLRKFDIAAADFVVSLNTVPFATSVVASFAKKYFASMELVELENRVKSMAATLSQAMEDPSTDGSSPTKRKQTATKKREPKAGAKETDHERETDKEFIKGPLSESEQGCITQAVDEYCQIHSITRDDFCNLLWDIPRTLPLKDKKALYAKISHSLPQRRADYIRHYLRRAYIPFHRAKFTKEEDKQILQLHSELGADWKAIASRMGRYQNDVRDRYRNTLQMSNTKSGEWSEFETQKFKSILQTYKSKDGMNWAAIAQQMGTRSRPQCRDKYHRLTATKESIRDSDKESLHPVIEAKQPSRNKILEGDVLHMLRLLRTSKAPDLQHAVNSGVLSMYHGIFPMDQIQDCIKLQLDLGKANLRKQTKKGIARLEQLTERELTRTLVAESDEDET